MKRNLVLPGFERDPIIECVQARDMGQAPQSLIDFTEGFRTGSFGVDARDPIARAVLHGSFEAEPVEIEINREERSALDDAHQLLVDETENKLSEDFSIEVQRTTLHPGERALWKQAQGWHVDITQIDMTHSPVLTLPLGVGTDEVVGTVNMIDVYRSLSRVGRSIISDNIEKRRKIMIPERAWIVRQKAATAAVVLEQYSIEHDDTLPYGLVVNKLPAGHILLLAGVAVIHRSSTNETQAPIVKSHLHVWPHETLKEKRRRLTQFVAS